MKDRLVYTLLGAALTLLAYQVLQSVVPVHAAAPKDQRSAAVVEAPLVDLEKLRYDIEEHVKELEQRLEKAEGRIQSLDTELASTKEKLEQTRLQGAGGRQQIITSLEGVSNRLSTFEEVMDVDGAGKLTLSANNITIQAGNELKLEGAKAGMQAGSLFFDAAMSSFDNVLKTHTLIAEETISQSYTPGPGNIW